MCSVQEMQRIDRELSSELVESPVNPAFINISAPLMGNKNPFFTLQLNGEGLWQWRKLHSHSQVFDSLQASLVKVGYELSSSARSRVGMAVYRRVDYIVKKARGVKNNATRQAERSQYWCQVALHADEITQMPGDIIHRLKKENEELMCENQELRNEMEDKASQLYDAMAQLRCLRGQNGHRGKHIENVGHRQQRRHLKEIREKAETALWFAETYGLTPKSLSLEDTTGQLINVTFQSQEFNQESIVCSEGNQDMSNEKNTSQPNKPYDNLDEEEKEKIRALLLIMDRFSISLEGYHELTQVEKSLPRTYLIESCTKVLDSKWEVRRTPGDAQGAELPFKLLLEHEVRQHLKNIELPVQTMKVKISGDGTRMSHSSNVFVCSFAIVENGQNYLSSSGNHTIAIIKGKEEYQTLKASLANVICDVNATIKEGHIVVDGQKVNLEFFLGGDYKFLLLAMGMKAATSNNSCIWCKIFKNDRCNMSHKCTHFQSAELLRVVDGTWSKQPGCHSEPFFSIPVSNVVLDELHLMLRITDRLEEGLIYDITKWDKDDNHKRQKSETHLQEFLVAVRSLGVSLRVYWVGEKLEWTSLLGGEKRILLKKLPDLFDKFLPQERVEITRQLWMNFRELLDILNKENLTDDDITAFETKAQSWGKQMLNMSGTGPGYSQTIIITPYMHSLVYHVPVMLRNHGSLKMFSGQGVEKKNDDLRRYFHRKINRWDAATNLLLVEKRQEELREEERAKRPYQKRDSSYWMDGGKQKAAKKVARISTSILSTTPMPQAMIESVLKKKKVPDLITLLEQRTGKKVNPRTRKQDLINALLSSETMPRSE